MHAKCSGRTRAGEACKAPAQAGSRWCINHDPARVTDLAEWRRRGGKAKSNQARARKALPAEPLSAEELHSYLGVVFRGLIGGKIEAPIATAAANVARTMVEIQRASEFEARLSALERSERGSA